VKHLVVLLALFSLCVILTGCASVPSGSSGKVAIGNISNLPQTLLSGAKLEHARSIAMGTARSKGWNITSAQANQLKLQRDLSASSPQAIALGSTLTPPKMEIETDLVERSDGTIVALKAFVITNPGTTEEKRINYTPDYESQLLISLSSLQSAWLEGRNQITSRVPIPSADEVAEQEASQDSPTADLVASEPVIASAPAPTLQAQDAAPATAPAPPATPPVPPATPPAPPATPPAPPATPPSPPQPQITSSAPNPTMPVASPAGLPETAIPAVPPIAGAAPDNAALSNDMLVLNSGARKGLWAYYAEDYARLRGCAIGDRGAVLMQETASFELHEVECAGTANIMVKCQGGVCEGVR